MTSDPPDRPVIARTNEDGSQQSNAPPSKVRNSAPACLTITRLPRLAVSYILPRRTIASASAPGPASLPVELDFVINRHRKDTYYRLARCEALGIGGIYYSERGNWPRLTASWKASRSRQARRFCAGCRSKKAGWSITIAGRGSFASGWW